MKLILKIILLLSCFSAHAQKDNYLLIGTYTGGKSEGIYVYKFDTATAENSFVSVIKSSNPSFLAVSPDKKYVYAVNENTEGTVSSYSFDAAKGLLTGINLQPSGGKDPCYVTVDKSGKWLFVGNYSSGNAGLFPLKQNGNIEPLKQLIQHKGNGPDTARQRSPHVHSTNLSANQQYLYVADLGIDKVMAYEFNNKTGAVTGAAVPFAKATGGSGPRHMAFDPANKFAYLVEEMSGTVVVYKMETGKLTAKQRISSLPQDFKGFISAADIHISPNGNFLYCSNRGESNTISIFSVNKSNGMLKLIGNQPTLGATPRNFNFDPSGKFLLVANQQTDEVVIFKIDQKTGLLADTGKRIQVPTPVCLQWIQ